MLKRTPLHLAVQSIFEEDLLIKFLEKGALLTLKNNSGFTPIGIAYNENKTQLIESFCNHVINNRKSYLIHRDSILDLASEIKDKPLKEKLVRGALIQELGTLKPNGQKIITLLEETGNPSFFIQQNMIQLSTLATSEKELYRYLVK